MNLSLVQPELWLTVLAFVVLGIDLLVGRSARGFVAWVAVFGLLGITAFSGGLLVTGSFAGGLYKADLYTSLFRELLTYMMEDPEMITFGIHLLFCAKNIERIGDHATNIAETVHYEITGEDIVGERPRAQPTAEDSDPTPNLSTH